MSAIMEWLAFVGFMGIFSLAFGFYMMTRKRMLWRKSDKTTTIPSPSDLEVQSGIEADAAA